MSNGLGDWFETQRTKNRGAWRLCFFIFLAVLVAINFVVHPHHAEYHYDIYPGFWEIFALGFTVGMVFLMKIIIQPFIVGPEEDDD
ncbi:hypothetical protein [Maridesulfovibrio bastinii]|uniref:hypothetical protein n=1 Tax=Maridesulfovibrio bastinii TaxID=47157 RepID=UPI000413A9CC|nr:hypothetical protein [Maridesulfovibrio bastinii]